MAEVQRQPHEHDASCGCNVGGMKYTPPDVGPIVVMRQPLEPVVMDAIDAVPVNLLPDLRLEGTLPVLRVQLTRGLARCGFAPQWLSDWLVDNVLFQARLFSELTNAGILKLRLEKVGDDGCARFHTDNVRQRLVCSYRGPGTEWIDPKVASKTTAGMPIREDSVRQLERGAIALMRGSKGATAERPAVIHRSPRIEGTEVIRLLLAIDACT